MGKGMRLKNCVLETRTTRVKKVASAWFGEKVVNWKKKDMESVEEYGRGGMVWRNLCWAG